MQPIYQMQTSRQPVSSLQEQLGRQHCLAHRKSRVLSAPSLESGNSIVLSPAVWSMARLPPSRCQVSLLKRLPELPPRPQRESVGASYDAWVGHLLSQVTPLHAAMCLVVWYRIAKVIEGNFFRVGRPDDSVLFDRDIVTTPMMRQWRGVVIV